MISPSARRIATPGVLLSALWLLAMHAIHPLVFCRDRDGARMESADLLDRCACRIHDESAAAIDPLQRSFPDETPSWVDAGSWRRCTDTALAEIWEASRGFRLAFRPTGSPSPAPEAWLALPEPIFPTPASGPSPPAAGHEGNSRLFSRRC